MSAPMTIEDRLAIEALYSRQSHLIDSGDFAGWAATFTPDGAFESATYQRTARGAEELFEFARGSNAEALSKGHQIRHWVNAIDLTSSSADAVTSRVYLMLVYVTPESVQIDRSVLLHDELVNEDGTWLVAFRRTTRDPSPANLQFVQN